MHSYSHRMAALSGALAMAMQQQGIEVKDEEVSPTERHPLLPHEDALANDVKAWVAAAGGKIVLQKADMSRIHQLADAVEAGRILNVRTKKREVRRNNLLAHPKGVFLIEHDWASLLHEEISALDKTNLQDFVLPFEHCGFEMRANGRHLVMIAMDTSELAPIRPGLFDTKHAKGGHLGAILFVKAGDYWCYFDQNAEQGDSHEVSAIGQAMWELVVGTCIAIDAEVAEHEVTRVSEKLNRRRVKDGKSPLPDFRRVTLARRHRATALPTGAPGSGTKKRLHFRRGHWRHYPDHKVWIKWMLVGNPDLGFVDHEYRV